MTHHDQAAILREKKQMELDLIRDFLKAVEKCPRCASCADVASDLLRHHPGALALEASSPSIAVEQAIAKAIAQEVAIFETVDRKDAGQRVGDRVLAILAAVRHLRRKWA